MTLLEKTYQATQLPEQKGLTKKLYNWRPMKPDGRVLQFNSFNIPNTGKANKTKEFLSKVLAFIDMEKNQRFTNAITVVPISCKNQKLVSITGSIQNASNLIAYMKKIGLLAEYDNTYQFNAYNDTYNRCKLYAYSYNTEVLIKEYCKNNNINTYEYKNYKKHNNNNTIVQKTELAFDTSTVRFNSKLHLLKPDNWSVAQFEAYLTDLLGVNYPWFFAYQQKADRLNELLDEERKIVFKPHFTWARGQKAVVKIGIRCTNSLVSCKKEKEATDPDWIRYREDVLQDRGLTHEYDVKSSVPRITLLLNKGFWCDPSIDLYEHMYKSFIQACPSETVPWNTHTRNVFKSFFMRAFFDTEKRLAAHIKFDISKRMEYKKEDWAGLDSVMKQYKRAVQSVIGDTSWDSEIFFHESCIYLDVLEELLTLDTNTVQVYDGFYYSKNIQTEVIEHIIKNKAMTYYCEYTLNKDNNNNNIYIKDNKDIIKEYMKDNNNIIKNTLYNTIVQKTVVPEDLYVKYKKICTYLPNGPGHIIVQKTDPKAIYSSKNEELKVCTQGFQKVMQTL